MSHSILKGVVNEFNVPTRIKVYSGANRHTLVEAEFRFRRPNRTQLSQLSTTIIDAQKRADFDRVAECIREYLIGWNMKGGDGQPVEFCDENIDLVLEDPDYLSGLIDAFMLVLNPRRGHAGN